MISLESVIVLLLLQHGTKKDTKMRPKNQASKETALHIAARGEALAVARNLLEQGAGVNVRDRTINIHTLWPCLSLQHNASIPVRRNTLLIT
jgi:hypothetical protein